MDKQECESDFAHTFTQTPSRLGIEAMWHRKRTRGEGGRVLQALPAAPLSCPSLALCLAVQCVMNVMAMEFEAARPSNRGNGPATSD